jgi:hypothetical protein
LPLLQTPADAECNVVPRDRSYGTCIELGRPPLDLGVPGRMEGLWGRLIQGDEEGIDQLNLLLLR